MTKLNKAMSELQLKGIKNKEEGDDVEDKKMEEDDRPLYDALETLMTMTEFNQAGCQRFYIMD